MARAKNGENKSTGQITSALGRLLPASQAARLLGIGDTKVRTLIARGEIVAVRTAEGRLSGVYEADALAWQARSPMPNSLGR